MTSFRGILNDNATETEFRVFIDLEKNGQYISDSFVGNVRYDAKINGDRCTIVTKRKKSFFDLDFFFGIFGDTDVDEFVYEHVEYQLTFKEINGEIIVIGREVTELTSLCYCSLICPKPRFFVATNKEEV